MVESVRRTLDPYMRQAESALRSADSEISEGELTTLCKQLPSLGKMQNAKAGIALPKPPSGTAW